METKEYDLLRIQRLARQGFPHLAPESNEEFLSQHALTAVDTLNHREFEQIAESAKKQGITPKLSAFLGKENVLTRIIEIFAKRHPDTISGEDFDRLSSLVVSTLHLCNPSDEERKHAIALVDSLPGFRPRLDACFPYDKESTGYDILCSDLSLISRDQAPPTSDPPVQHESKPKSIPLAPQQDSGETSLGTLTPGIASFWQLSRSPRIK